MKILLVDREQLLLESLSQKLAEQNYIVDAVRDGQTAWEFTATYTYSLIILAFNLGGIDGLTLCQRWRAQGHHIPILFLTDGLRKQDKIKALNAGADDCLSKPFDFEELLARVRALLRRINTTALPKLTWEQLELDLNTCEVTYQNKLLSLTPKEYSLVELFLRHPSAVFSIEEIVDHLWSSEEYPSEATVRSHLRRLREKLKEVGAPFDLIETVRGLGYRLKSFSDSSSNHLAVQPLKVSASAWQNYREKSCHQLAVLKETVEQLKQECLTTVAYQKAQDTLKNLAENLQILGCFQGAELIQKLETVLQSEQDSQKEKSWQFEAFLTALYHQLELENSHPQGNYNQENPCLLILGEDSELTRKLTTLANQKGIHTEKAVTNEQVKSWLRQLLPNTAGKTNNRPDAILLRLAFTRPEDPDLISLTLSERLSLISEINLRAPSIPVIVISDQEEFLHRLEITRRGARFCLLETVSPWEIVNCVQTVLFPMNRQAKIIIVDQDRELLKMLPSLLRPWGLEVTTLDEPSLLEEVLQAVEPDLLVLSLINPDLSGLELCRVVRSHPDWCPLPLVILADHIERLTENQVFAAGADDLILKPFVISDFAHRLLYRLERIRWQSQLICAELGNRPSQPRHFESLGFHSPESKKL